MSDTDDATDMETDTVTLAHGAGTGTTRSYIEETIVPTFDGAGPDARTAVGLAALDDGAVHRIGDQSLVVTTDSHVVSPLSFPGGDIGQLAIAGTVNDLAVMGATEPLSLTCSLVIEEGLPTATVETMLDSMRDTCETAGCTITTGDTKVMGSEDVDGLVINTTGVGVVSAGGHVPVDGLTPGDKLVVSGPVGDHGLALLAEREGIDISGDLRSDVRPVNNLVATALEHGTITAMTDPTRGGLATALHEMARASDVGVTVREDAIPVREPTAAAGELLGIDPLHVANEGVVLVGVSPEDAHAVTEALTQHEHGSAATIIGEATAEHTGRVLLDTGFGRRYLHEPEGEQLPRIC